MPRGKFENATGVHDFPLRWPADTVVRVKSGNGTVNGEQVSWLVGALETGGRQFVFASRARAAAGTLGATAGADLALRVLNTIYTREGGEAMAEGLDGRNAVSHKALIVRIPPIGPTADEAITIGRKASS